MLIQDVLILPLALNPYWILTLSWLLIIDISSHNHHLLMDPYTFNMSLIICMTFHYIHLLLDSSPSLFAYNLHYLPSSSFVPGSLHFYYSLIICITYYNLDLVLDPYTFIMILSFGLHSMIFICYWILTLSLFILWFA